MANVIPSKFTCLQDGWDALAKELKKRAAEQAKQEKKAAAEKLKEEKARACITACKPKAQKSCGVDRLRLTCLLAHSGSQLRCRPPSR